MAEDSNIGEMHVEIRAGNKKVAGDVKKVEKQIKKGTAKAGKEAGKSFSKGFGNALSIGVGIIALRKLGQTVGKLLELGRAQVIAETKVRNGIKATGGIAGKTTSQLKKMANQLQALTGIGDEAILSKVQAQLLTFTNIRKDIFDGLTAVTLDINQVINDGNLGSLTSLSIQLGKALNDPVANLGALGRMGIQFSKSQKEVITNLVKENKLYDAQAMILKELNTQYGGQAKAVADSLGGTKQLSAEFSDLAEAFGLGILKIFTDMAGGIAKATDFIRDQTRRTKLFFGIVDEDAVKEANDNIATAWATIFKGYDKGILQLETKMIETELKLIKNKRSAWGLLAWLGFDNEQNTKDLQTIKDLEGQLAGINILLEDKPAEGGGGGGTIEKTVLSMKELQTQLKEVQGLMATADPDGKLFDTYIQQITDLQTKIAELEKKIFDAQVKYREGSETILGAGAEGKGLEELQTNGLTAPNQMEEVKATVEPIVTAGQEFSQDMLTSLGTGQSLASTLQSGLFNAGNTFVDHMGQALNLISQVLGLISAFTPASIVKVGTKAIADITGVGDVADAVITGSEGSLNKNFNNLTEGSSSKGLEGKLVDINTSVQAMNKTLIKKDFAPVINNSIDADSLNERALLPSQNSLKRRGMKLDELS